jgi:hypothetical protein
MRTATDIHNEMTQLHDRKQELIKEMRGLSRDSAEHWTIWLELGDIQDNLKILREEFKAQVAWDQQNILDKE